MPDRLNQKNGTEKKPDIHRPTSNGGEVHIFSSTDLPVVELRTVSSSLTLFVDQSVNKTFPRIREKKREENDNLPSLEI